MNPDFSHPGLIAGKPVPPRSVAEAEASDSSADSTTFRDKPTLLIVEDEAIVRQVLSDYLRQDFSVESLADGTHATQHILSAEPSVVILDIMLPGKDGLSICREVREFSDVPILMLTARVEEADRLRGLNSGADDYVCKPFSPREVVARVKAIWKRAYAPRQTMRTVTYGPLKMIPSRSLCVVDGVDIDLTGVEFRLLLAIVSRAGDVVGRDELAAACYSDHRVVSPRTIDSHIRNIRQKLKPRTDAIAISSVYGRGYRLTLSD